MALEVLVDVWMDLWRYGQTCGGLGGPAYISAALCSLLSGRFVDDHLPVEVWATLWRCGRPYGGVENPVDFPLLMVQY